MDQIEIAIGTYENLILGYRIEEKLSGGNENKAFGLESSFTTDSHCGALRCLSVSPQGVLVSSSTDDSIRLHSLKKRREVGGLFQHDGSVNCIRFFKGGHMFSASEDGTICLWKCKNWELLRVLKGHRCHVMAVAVHPSGKLGLSIGSDRSFFTWDMTTGKLAFKRKVDEVAQDLVFTNDGNHYAMIYQKRIEVCALEDTEIIQEIKFESRINDVCFVESQENIMAVGGDDGKVTILDVISSNQLAQKTFQGRVRSLCAVTTKMGTLLFVASSSGAIRVCKLCLEEDDDDDKFETLVDYNSGTRLTCMAVYAPQEVLEVDAKVKDKSVVQEHVKPSKKRKAEDSFEKDSEEDDSSDNKEESDDNDDENANANDVEEESAEEEAEEEIQPKQKKKKVSDSPVKKKKKNLKPKTLAKKGKVENSKSKSKSKVLPPAKRRRVT